MNNKENDRLSTSMHSSIYRLTAQNVSKFKTATLTP